MHFILPLVASATALAMDPAPHSMERILVTAVASRVSEDADATPATVSVIEREALDRSVSRDLAEALRYEPGVSVERGAARFGLGNIAIRGLDGNRVEMLYDGVRLPEGYRVGSFSNASRQPFDTALASRIEVLRGPASALYGSDALAGVLSVTTLDPADLLRPGAALSGFAAADYASVDESAQATAALAARAGGIEFFLGGSHADGHERDNHGDVGGTGAARTQPNPQDAGATSGLAKLVVPTARGDRWRATLDRYERRVRTDVLSLNPQSIRTTSLAGDDRAERSRVSVDALFHALGFVDRLSVVAYGQRSLTAQDTVEVRENTTAACLSAPGTVSCRREARFRLEQEETGLTAIGQSGTGRQQWVYGAEWSRVRAEESRDGQQTNLVTGAVSNVVGTDVFPTRDFPSSRVERVGIFAQDEIALAPAAIIPALRYDRFDMRPQDDATYAAANPGRVPVGVTDSRWSPKLGALLPVGGGMTLTLQAATGFRAPPYYDVNVGLSNLPLGYTVIPNPDLKPETSRGIEGGVRGRHGALDWSLVAYRTDYDDLIVSRAPLPCPADPRCVPGAPITFQSQNVTSARIEGVEVRLEARLAPAWIARLGGAAARGDDRSRGVPLNTVDPPKVVAGVEYAAGAWSAQLHVTHVGAKTRVDNSNATFFAPPAFTVVDLAGSWTPLRNLTVFAGLFNVADEKYWLWSDVRNVSNPGASVDRYTQPGRNAAVRLKVTF